jgi:dCMP deaminase
MLDKTQNHLTWNQFFMGLALLSSCRSKDPNTQVGACIAGPDNRVVSLGYNGFPRGCDIEAFPWNREGEPLKTKYPFVVHAECNAIYNAITIPKRSTIYCTMHPCNICAQAIVQNYIQKVVYLNNPYAEEDSVKAASIIFIEASVTVVKYKPESPSGLHRVQRKLGKL